MAQEPPISDDAIRRRTGRGWDEWFELLDGWGATDRPHREIARWVREEHGADGWSSQSIAVAYERARGMRAVGENTQGFNATASRTIAVPVERLFDAWTDEELRERWLPGAELRERTATRPRTARWDWEDGRTRVIAGFSAKGEGRSNVGMAHERLADAEEAARMKAYWRERLGALKDLLEG